jgi:hypothetical protein
MIGENLIGYCLEEAVEVVFLEELRKPIKLLSQHGQFPNRLPREWKSEAWVIVPGLWFSAQSLDVLHISVLDGFSFDLFTDGK